MGHGSATDGPPVGRDTPAVSRVAVTLDLEKREGRHGSQYWGCLAPFFLGAPCSLSPAFDHSSETVWQPGRRIQTESHPQPFLDASMHWPRTIEHLILAPLGWSLSPPLTNGETEAPGGQQTAPGFQCTQCRAKETRLVPGSRWMFFPSPPTAAPQVPQASVLPWPPSTLSGAPTCLHCSLARSSFKGQKISVKPRPTSSHSHGWLTAAPELLSY